jgi:phage-related protein
MLPMSWRANEADKPTRLLRLRPPTHPSNIASTQPHGPCHDKKSEQDGNGASTQSRGLCHDKKSKRVTFNKQEKDAVLLYIFLSKHTQHSNHYKEEPLQNMNSKFIVASHYSKTFLHFSKGFAIFCEGDRENTNNGNGTEDNEVVVPQKSNLPSLLSLASAISTQAELDTLASLDFSGISGIVNQISIISLIGVGDQDVGWNPTDL